MSFVALSLSLVGPRKLEGGGQQLNRKLCLFLILLPVVLLDLGKILLKEYLFTTYKILLKEYLITKFKILPEMFCTSITNREICILSTKLYILAILNIQKHIVFFQKFQACLSALK